MIRFTSNSEKELHIINLYSPFFMGKVTDEQVLLPTLKLLVLKVGHVNNLGNIMYIGIARFVQALPSPICIFCISVAVKYISVNFYFTILRCCNLFLHVIIFTISRISFCTSASFHSHQL